jgi:hypothetical protein
MTEDAQLDQIRDLIENIRVRSTGGDPPRPPDGGRRGDGENGGMESRVAKLEIAVEYIQRDIVEIKGHINALRNDVSGIRTTDFRIIFGAITTVAIGLAGLMAKGFGWI